MRKLIKQDEAILEQIRKDAEEAEIKMLHGRIDEPLEYVEFDGNMASRVKFFTQRSGDWWIVYRIYPGKKGKVTTLATCSDFIISVTAAFGYCKDNYLK